MRVQNVFVSSLAISALGVLSSSFGLGGFGLGNFETDRADALAQVPNADLACYLHSPDGVQYDLSVLCGDNSSDSEPTAVVLQSGDVQVTLRWDTSDDLDLYVRDPNGDVVSFENPSVPSGGQLDVDANADCASRMASPVENIFWPENGGIPGEYVVTVDLFSYCGVSSDDLALAPINFTLTTLVQGVTQTRSSTISTGQSLVSFPFTFSDTDSTPTDAATLPASETTALPPAP